MKIGVLGTAIVGRTVGAKLSALGHDVMIGTRDVARTRAVAQPDRMGNPPISAWLKDNPKVRLGTLAEAAAHGELLVNATAGTDSLEALRQAGEANLTARSSSTSPTRWTCLRGCRRPLPSPTPTRWRSKSSARSPGLGW